MYIGLLQYPANTGETRGPANTGTPHEMPDDFLMVAQERQCSVYLLRSPRTLQDTLICYLYNAHPDDLSERFRRALHLNGGHLTQSMRQAIGAHL